MVKKFVLIFDPTTSETMLQTTLLRLSCGQVEWCEDEHRNLFIVSYYERFCFGFQSFM